MPYWEISTVVSFFDTYGFASRACGCNIFIHEKELPSDVQLRVGDRISHRSVEITYKGKPAVQALEIDLYVPEEQQVQ
jgi:hypothetical protein